MDAFAVSTIEFSWFCTNNVTTNEYKHLSIAATIDVALVAYMFIT